MKLCSYTTALLVTVCCLVVPTVSSAQTQAKADYVRGKPISPSLSWQLSLGGRLYDNWAAQLGKSLPKSTHPAWPKSNKKTGGVTWRCKSCHGWDYEGAKGNYAKGAYSTGIKGVGGVGGKDPKQIVKLFSDATHGFSDTLIPRDAKLLLALFLSKGLHKTSAHVNADGTVNGNAARGKEIYQNVCAACHGFDGRMLNWGDAKTPGYVGTEASANPWEVLHKIRNGHPGHYMVSLRFLSVKEAANVLKYAQTLPAK